MAVDWQVVKLNEESAVRYRYSIGQISFGPEIVAIKIYELYSPCTRACLRDRKLAAESEGNERRRLLFPLLVKLVNFYHPSEMLRSRSK